jgi:hypothetical protein
MAHLGMVRTPLALPKVTSLQIILNFWSQPSIEVLTTITNRAKTQPHLYQSWDAKINIKLVASNPTRRAKISLLNLNEEKIKKANMIIFPKSRTTKRPLPVPPKKKQKRSNEPINEQNIMKLHNTTYSLLIHDVLNYTSQYLRTRRRMMSTSRL